MYLGIDVGGTKVLLAVFGQDGQIIDEHRFPTNQKFELFIADLDRAIKNELKDHRLSAVCCAIAGFEIDRTRGVVPHFGNLPWKDVHLAKNLESVLPGAKIIVENDAKLAGLSEALNVKADYKNVLYLTLGTGIGVAHIVNGVIDAELSDRGGDGLVLDHDGQLMAWEDFASGKALVKRYGKKASEIVNPAIWAKYAADVAQGLEHFIDLTLPEIVIVGGGVGAHFERFGSLLHQELAKLGTSKTTLSIIKAKRPEEAVIYGCYDYIKQQA